MALYFLDCEFNSFEGQLLSLSLISENGHWLHLRYPHPPLQDIHPWVLENVIPHMDAAPVPVQQVDQATGARAIQVFLLGDPQPVIIADWPGDISHFCNALMPEPGQVVALPAMVFQLIRAQAYPNDIEGAVQHNSWWDALALRYFFTQQKDWK